MTTAELLVLALNLIDELNEAEGVVDDAALEAALTAFAEKAGDKLSGLRAVAVQLQGQDTILKAEIERITKLRKHYQALNGAIHRRATALAIALEATGGDPNEKGIAKLKESKRAAFPEDLSLWPAEYVKITEVKKPDSAGLKKAIEKGEIEPPEGFAVLTRRYVKFEGVDTVE